MKQRYSRKRQYFYHPGLPEFEYTTWYGVFVPARTAGGIVDLVNAELQRALATSRARLPGIRR